MEIRNNEGTTNTLGIVAPSLFLDNIEKPVFYPGRETRWRNHENGCGTTRRRSIIYVLYKRITPIVTINIKKYKTQHLREKR